MVTAEDIAIGRKVRESIDNEARKAFEKAGFTLTKIARELKAIAFSDIADYLQVDDVGSAKPIALDQIPAQKRKAIKKISEKRRILNGKEDDTILEDTFAFELWDKLAALGMAIKIMGLEAPQRHEVGGKNGGPIPVSALTTMADDELERIARGGSAGTPAETQGAK